MIISITFCNGEALFVARSEFFIYFLLIPCLDCHVDIAARLHTAPPTHTHQSEHHFSFGKSQYR